MKEKIRYNYAQDQFFEEMKDSENLRNRLDLINQAAPYVGTFFSKEYVRRKILRLSEEEIEEIDEQMDEEMAENPNGMMPAQPGQPMGQPMGQPQTQPTPDQQAQALGNAVNQNQPG